MSQGVLLAVREVNNSGGSAETLHTAPEVMPTGVPSVSTSCEGGRDAPMAVRICTPWMFGAAMRGSPSRSRTTVASASRTPAVSRRQAWISPSSMR